MNPFYLIVNIVGLLVFIGLGWLLSHDRKHIQWKSVGCLVLLNLVISWFLTSFEWGRAAVQACANGFTWIVDIAYQGVNFTFGNWINSDGSAVVYNAVDSSGQVIGTVTTSLNFVVQTLMPILLIVPLFDILTYIGFLPWLIKWIGRGLGFITRRPKFETFFAVEMMFLGNTEALAVSKIQLERMKADRNVTLAMMSMSCITASIVGAYIQMIPGEFVITAIPLNCINALLISHMLYPVEVTPEEDVIYGLEGAGDEIPVDTSTPEAREVESKEVAAYKALPWYKKIFKHNPAKPKKEPFFTFLGDSILTGGQLILIIAANVTAFVALTGLIDGILGLIWSNLSLENILAVILFVPAWLLGLPVNEAWQFAQFMGLKLVTNEFVVMGEIQDTVNNFAQHYKAEICVFTTSFANLGTLGMVIACFKSMVNKEKNDAISKQIGRIFLSGILVSLCSAAMVGLFEW
ncbi:NupC/NupG family nucleoside CNT transporter [Bifidobacterium choloepi]|uniref:Nucleoside transporter n=1 Tax=Bifidobacterium choloepi TaxID=2614131 RepID=A0A6I5NAP2_9BIFI|nr:nucleoside transporter C-terminal domain-containing protein [Bifidobacterium choloepi]NEG69520.1 nucleoside transporter [Bifidobacterium choloepi]